MSLARTLFVTCMPLETPRSASMAFMNVILEKYPDTFVWFSLRSPDPGSENPFSIPYSYARPIQRLSRLPWLRQSLNLIPWAWNLGYKASKFGRVHGVQVVLADLAFEAIVAGRVAARVLGVPLLVTVHDDPVNRIRVKNYPRWLVKVLEHEVVKTMKAAVRCGVISDYMGEIYRERYKVETSTLFIGVEESKCLPFKTLDVNKATIIIGSVGSMNSSENWNLLIDAIRMLNRQFGADRFQILHIGKLPEQLSAPNDVVQVTGWVSEDEFLCHLARVDIGFLNWSFDPVHAETGRTSFPLKTHSYIQGQVPMLALGPVGSSVIRYVEEFQCGLVCTQASAAELAEGLRRFVRDQGSKARALRTGLEELKRGFSRHRFFQDFERFLDVSK